MSKTTPREELNYILTLCRIGLTVPKNLKEDAARTLVDPDDKYVVRAREGIEQLIHAEVLAVLDKLEKELDRPSPDTGYNKMKFAITQLKQRYGGKEQE